MNVVVHPENSLSLFSGIGSLDLAVARVFPGCRTLAYVEGEGYAAAVLAARMASGDLDDAPIWSDIRTFPGRALRDRVDLVVGGFPCQDLSLAGKRAGIGGERSGLYFDLIRTVRDVRPRYLFLENVAAIATGRALDAVLGALAELGFDAEWGCLRASDVGAPHRRDRWFCLAWDRESLADPIDGGHAWRASEQERRQEWGTLAQGSSEAVGGHVADAARLQRPGQGRGLRDGGRVREVLQAVGDAGHLQPQEPQSADGIDGQRSAVGWGQFEPPRAGADGRAPCRCDAARDGGHRTTAGHEVTDRLAVGDPIGGSLQRRGEPGVLAPASRRAEAEGDQRERCGNAAGHPGAGECGAVEHAGVAGLPRGEYRREPTAAQGERDPDAAACESGRPRMGGPDDAAGLAAVPVLRGLPLHDPSDARPRLRVPGDRGMGDGPLHGWPGFPPGPGDRDGWQRFIEQYPDLAPATERAVRRSPHESSAGLDVCLCPRVDRLRGLGNAVVATQAEAALRALWLRAFGE